MNRLVIIGNGFDLAHDLPTSYQHFINDFWKDFKDTYQEAGMRELAFLNQDFDNFQLFLSSRITGYKDFISGIENYCKSRRITFDKKQHRAFIDEYGDDPIIFEFRNEFFKIITLESLENWVDIENLYYELLVQLARKSTNSRLSYNGDVKKLNKEFAAVKNLLNSYLTKNVCAQYDFRGAGHMDLSKIIELFRLRPRSLASDPEHEYFLEFPDDDRSDLVQLDLAFAAAMETQRISGTIPWPKNLLLDFNYTPTGITYANHLINLSTRDYGYTEHISIHGQAGAANDINFGFGDEMDDSYKVLEKTNNKAFLANIKSFRYLHNTNYRKLLRFISERKFQVYIFGHSCGLSDRILLNTIFEHHNCRSIKIFYHQKGDNNNYTELTQSISLHFNKKDLMREKIVDRSLCQPLPQDVRFKKVTE